MNSSDIVARYLFPAIIIKESFYIAVTIALFPVYNILKIAHGPFHTSQACACMTSVIPSVSKLRLKLMLQQVILKLGLSTL